MLDQAPPEQPSRDSGPPPLESRIARIFGPKEPQAPPQQKAPQQRAPEPEPEVSLDADADSPDVSEVQEEGAADPAPQEETFELDIEGEKYVLPKKLEKGFLQERDYTQKSQSLADQRRLVEVKEQQFR